MLVILPENGNYYKVGSIMSDDRTMEKNVNCMYSAILPIFNEESCLKEFLDSLMKVLEKMGECYEIVCIDDGSYDQTWPILQEASRKNQNIKCIKFQRNFGHQIAISAGLKHCTGKYVAILDSDGQDPPEVLPRFFEKCKEGYDVVYAIRKKRKENFIKKICYAAFYRLYKIIVPFYVPLDAGDFSVISRRVVDFMNTLDERNPFVRGLRSWYGGKQIGLEYEREKRISGRSKYSYYKLLHLAVNASVSFSKFPLRLISLMGIIISSVSFIGGVGLIIMKLFIGINLIGWTSTALLIIFFGGLNLFVLGVMGEYIGSIFDEVKRRPLFLIEETIGI